MRGTNHHRGQRVDVELGDDRTLRSRPDPAEPIQVLVRDETVEFRPGARHEFLLERRP
jgi:hypothetical protein